MATAKIQVTLAAVSMRITLPESALKSPSKPRLARTSPMACPAAAPSPKRMPFT